MSHTRLTHRLALALADAPSCSDTRGRPRRHPGAGAAAAAFAAALRRAVPCLPPPVLLTPQAQPLANRRQCGAFVATSPLPFQTLCSTAFDGMGVCVCCRCGHGPRARNYAATASRPSGKRWTQGQPEKKTTGTRSRFVRFGFRGYQHRRRGAAITTTMDECRLATLTNTNGADSVGRALPAVPSTK